MDFRAMLMKKKKPKKVVVVVSLSSFTYSHFIRINIGYGNVNKCCFILVTTVHILVLGQTSYLYIFSGKKAFSYMEVQLVNTAKFLCNAIAISFFFNVNYLNNKTPF